jgi:hypothetical protein
MMNPDHHLSILRDCGISLAEWYVLSLIGRWPIPYGHVSKTAASHSEQDARGSVGQEDCEKALTACFTRNLLRIIEDTSLAEIRSYVREQKLLGPVYGYPVIADVDFTSRGAILYQDLCRQLFGKNWGSSHAYRVGLANGVSRYYFQRKKPALNAMRGLNAGTITQFSTSLVSIGPWCVYWWMQFSRGYQFDHEEKGKTKEGHTRGTG